MTVILPALVVGLGIVIGWWATTKISQLFEWMERRR